MQAPAGNLGVRVFDGADNASDLRGDQSLGTGRRAAVMTAGLQCHIGGGAARPITRCRQRMHFGMAGAGQNVIPLTDVLAIADDDAADSGLGMVVVTPRAASVSACAIQNSSDCVSVTLPSFGPLFRVGQFRF